MTVRATIKGEDNKKPSKIIAYFSKTQNAIFQALSEIFEALFSNETGYSGDLFFAIYLTVIEHRNVILQNVDFHFSMNWWKIK